MGSYGGQALTFHTTTNVWVGYVHPQVVRSNRTADNGPLLHSAKQLWRCYNVSRRKKYLGVVTKDSRQGKNLSLREKKLDLSRQQKAREIELRLVKNNACMQIHQR
jgi:hypothetical protein